MLMPGGEIGQLSDVELVEAARANSDDRTQRQLQAEMWRRTTLEARRADLTATERARRGETIALWAIELAVAAVTLALALVASQLSADGGGGICQAGLGVSVMGLVGNSVALLVTANARTIARARLREFDAEFFPGP
ncbi:MAG: hypothetical protein ABR950_08675 [Candidatus Dormibacteria bacterium]|jgi:hypothetical protein